MNIERYDDCVTVDCYQQTVIQKVIFKIHHLFGFFPVGGQSTYFFTGRQYGICWPEIRRLGIRKMIAEYCSYRKHIRYICKIMKPLCKPKWKQEYTFGICYSSYTVGFCKDGWLYTPFVDNVTIAVMRRERLHFTDMCCATFDRERMIGNNFNDPHTYHFYHGFFPPQIIDKFAQSICYKS